MKYLSDQLGASVEQNTILKGTHPPETLIKFLDKFIEKYVLCTKCHYPELSMGLQGKKNLVFKCNSCGQTGSLDTSNKAGIFMVKNPDKLHKTEIKTEEKGGDIKKKKKKDKEEGKAEEVAAAAKTPDLDSDEISKYRG